MAENNGSLKTKPPKAKKRGRVRAQRYTSNVFSMFNQAQIQEFKEAFNMIDQNHDGFLDKEDLIEMLTSLGKNPTDGSLDEMVNQAPGPLNFTMFLTMFGEKMTGADPEDVILNAFGCFDEKNEGKLDENTLRDLMTTMGDRWSHEQVDDLFYGAPISKGMFDYTEFVRTLKHGAVEKEEDQQASSTTAKPSSNVANTGSNVSKSSSGGSKASSTVDNTACSDSKMSLNVAKTSPSVAKTSSSPDKPGSKDLKKSPIAPKVSSKDVKTSSNAAKT